MKRLLLLGNSQDQQGQYLRHAESEITRLLGNKQVNGLFIPYAQVLTPFDSFTAGARLAFQCMGHELTSIHTMADPREAIQRAAAIVIGGGNTFHLLHHLAEKNLLSAIRYKVESGTPFIAWSAGATVACPSIKTTNDMPIVEPESLQALGLVPFQINPHYVDTSDDSTVESREERLNEFTEVNPDVYVVGLREGSMLRVEGPHIELFGPLGARIFVKGKSPKDYRTGDSIDFLLQAEGDLVSVT
jgi:dipeptidase E